MEVWNQVVSGMSAVPCHCMHTVVLMTAVTLLDVHETSPDLVTCSAAAHWLVRTAHAMCAAAEHVTRTGDVSCTSYSVTAVISTTVCVQWHGTERQVCLKLARQAEQVL